MVCRRAPDLHGSFTSICLSVSVKIHSLLIWPLGHMFSESAQSKSLATAF